MADQETCEMTHHFRGTPLFDMIRPVVPGDDLLIGALCVRVVVWLCPHQAVTGVCLQETSHVKQNLIRQNNQLSLSFSLKRFKNSLKKNYEMLQKENDQQNSVWVKGNKFPHL